MTEGRKGRKKAGKTRPKQESEEKESNERGSVLSDGGRWGGSALLGKRGQPEV